MSHFLSQAAGNLSRAVRTARTSLSTILSVESELPHFDHGRFFSEIRFHDPATYKKSAKARKRAAAFGTIADFCAKSGVDAAGCDRVVVYGGAHRSFSKEGQRPHYTIQCLKYGERNPMVFLRQSDGSKWTRLHVPEDKADGSIDFYSNMKDRK